MVKCHVCGKLFEGEVTDPNSNYIMANRICSDCEDCVGKKSSTTLRNLESLDWSKLPRIIAVDFDGVLSDGVFPKIGKINELLLYRLRKEQQNGTRIILWTCRSDWYLMDAVYALKPYISFDEVNRNIPEVIELCGEDTRKIYADVYIDDKAFRYRFDQDNYRLPANNNFENPYWMDYL